jgi:hypothetical protein
MSFSEALEQRRAAIEAIDYGCKPDRSVPFAEQIHEAMNLYEWCLPDKDRLVAGGLDWALVEDLEGRVAAALVAQRRYVAVRDGGGPVENRWRSQAERARERIRELKHICYGAREMLGLDLNVPEGTYVKDEELPFVLSWLAALAAKNTDAFSSIGFDPERVEDTRRMAKQTALAYASNTINAEALSARVLRDRAFVYLEEATGEIRRCGRYVFAENPRRRRGYESAYRRQHRGRAAQRGRKAAGSSDCSAQTDSLPVQMLTPAEMPAPAPAEKHPSPPSP